MYKFKIKGPTPQNVQWTHCTENCLHQEFKVLKRIGGLGEYNNFITTLMLYFKASPNFQLQEAKVRSDIRNSFACFVDFATFVWDGTAKFCYSLKNAFIKHRISKPHHFLLSWVLYYLPCSCLISLWIFPNQ